MMMHMWTSVAFSVDDGISNLQLSTSPKGPPHYLTEGRMIMTESGLAIFIAFSCLGLLSCIKLCIFLCRFFLFFGFVC